MMRKTSAVIALVLWQQAANGDSVLDKKCGAIGQKPSNGYHLLPGDTRGANNPSNWVKYIFGTA